MSSETRVYAWSIQDGKGEASIECDENTENDTAHALVEKKVSKGVPFGPGYRSFRLLRRSSGAPA